MGRKRLKDRVTYARMTRSHRTPLPDCFADNLSRMSLASSLSNRNRCFVKLELEVKSRLSALPRRSRAFRVAEATRPAISAMVRSFILGLCCSCTPPADPVSIPFPYPPRSPELFAVLSQLSPEREYVVNDTF
ncbi:hypothetical protein BV25DRAFT_772052 [Artomyces pyxidatus]|uniref:Uncharacterized protein n=1 Tax=Artomyces pyxidatus TaxID=48021 RepID=A0ACB8SXU3_9AGAM|nr:hypothetical protein BV25DRAFT_772052 [Artomyces pyxidatus]